MKFVAHLTPYLPHIILCMGAKITSFQIQITADQRACFAKAATGTSPTADENIGDLGKQQNGKKLRIM